MKAHGLRRVSADSGFDELLVLVCGKERMVGRA